MLKDMYEECKNMYEECKKEMDETVCAGVGGCNFGVEVPASASVWVAPEFKPKKLNNNKLANPNFAKRLGKGKKSFSQGWGKEEKKKKVFESQSPTEFDFD